MRPTTKISGREHSILLLASKGFTDKAIAAELDISVKTVSTYWSRMRTKTGGTSRSQMIMQILGKELEEALEEAREAIDARDRLIELAEVYAVFDVDLESNLTNWNPGILRVLGYEKEDFIGKPFAMLFTEEDRRRGQPEFEILQATQHGRFVERRYHLRKDGSEIFVDGTIVSISNREGDLDHFSKIMRDDSARKSLQEEIERLPIPSKPA